jgi:hypothetical protein
VLGAVERRGSNPYGGEDFVTNSLFRQVSLGESLACGVLDGGAIACWGGENYGQAVVPAALR